MNNEARKTVEQAVEPSRPREDAHQAVEFDRIIHISRSEAARRARRTTRTLKNWERTKGLKAIRINKRLFVYMRLDFELLIQEMGPLPAPNYWGEL